MDDVVARDGCGLWIIAGDCEDSIDNDGNRERDMDVDDDDGDGLAMGTNTLTMCLHVGRPLLSTPPLEDDEVARDACDSLMCLHVLRPSLSTPPLPNLNDGHVHSYSFPFRDT